MSRRERLSALDASFLHIESKTAPSHGVMVSIVDGPIDFDLFRNDIRRKLDRIPRLSQLIRHVPGNLAHPSWEPSTTFSLDDHLHHIELETPQPEHYAEQLTVDIFHRGMDKRKPLWAMYVVNGLEGGRSALIHSLHHCMVDGASAVMVWRILFGEDGHSSDRTAIVASERPRSQAAIPILLDALADGAAGMVELLLQGPAAAVRILRAVMSPEFRAGRNAMRAYHEAPGVRFPFNARLSGKVQMATGTFPLDQLRAVGAASGGTVNDVLLTMVSGAMQKYALDCGLDIAGKYFKFQMPSNVRRPDQNGRMGNFATPVPVQVPLDVADPHERLVAVIERTRLVKDLNLAYGISLAIQFAQTMLTPPGMALVEAAYGWPWLRSLELRIKPTPATNMFVTNIPGGTETLRIAGQRILRRHVLVPLLPNNGLVCGALSYESSLAVSYTGDAVLKPGVDVLMEYTHEAFGELLKRARNTGEASGPTQAEILRTASSR
jgi:diacylglycerol O-acyltransferase / wax synthase